jgi:hypothetical protein
MSPERASARPAPKQSLVQVSPLGAHTVSQHGEGYCTRGEAVWERELDYTGEVVCARYFERVLGPPPVRFLGPSVMARSSHSVCERMSEERGLDPSPTSRNQDVLGQWSKLRVVQRVSGSGDS